MQHRQYNGIFSVLDTIWINHQSGLVTIRTLCLVLLHVHDSCIMEFIEWTFDLSQMGISLLIENVQFPQQLLFVYPTTICNV